MGLKINTKVCCGCRICELACSFHHCGAFAPEVSSLKVLSDHLSGNIIVLVNSSCDFCEEESQLLCVKYCPEGALKEAKEYE